MSKRQNNANVKAQNARNNGVPKNGKVNTKRSNKRHSNNTSYTEDVKRTTTNDPSWYNRIPGLSEYVASIPFNVVSNLPATIDSLTEKSNFVNPNVAVVYHSLISPLSVTGSTKRDTTVHALTQKLFTVVRRANSGAKNYEPEDLFRMIISMAAVYMRINLLMRIYGMANFYSGANRAFPFIVFKAMGVDYDDVKLHMPEMCARINLMINRASVMKIPSNITFIYRLASLYQNYFIDSTDARDTIYIPMPDQKGLLDLTDDEQLIYYDGGFSTSLQKAEDILSSAEAFIDKVLTSQDFGIMQGDLEKAFGHLDSIQLVNMPSDYTLPPIYDRSRLTQIRNADVVLMPTGSSTYLGFDASTGRAIGSFNESNVGTTYANKFGTTSYGGWNDVKEEIRTRYLCLDADQLTPDWVLEATRNKSYFGVDAITKFEIIQVLPDVFLDAVATTNGQSYSQEALRRDLGMQLLNCVALNNQYIKYFADVSPIAAAHVHKGMISNAELSSYLRTDLPSAYSKISSIFKYAPTQVVRTAFSPRLEAGSTAKRTIVGSYDVVLSEATIIQPITEVQLEQIGYAVWASLLSVDV